MLKSLAHEGTAQFLLTIVALGVVFTALTSIMVGVGNIIAGHNLVTLALTSFTGG